MNTDLLDHAVSAESASRFLRRKNGNFEETLEFASRLLDGKYEQLYFPRKEQFLMDWWFDRSGLEIRNVKFWALFKRIWNSLDYDIQLLLYKRHKFLDTVYAAMNENLVEENDGRLQLASNIFEAVKCVVDVGIYLRTTVECMCGIVASYLKLVIASPECASDEWSGLIFKIYDGTLYGVSNYKKKITAVEGLSAAMSLVGIVDNTTILYSRLCDIIRDLMFSPSIIKENQGESFTHFFSVLEACGQSVTSNHSTLDQILHLGLDKLSKTRQKSVMPALCEQMLNRVPSAADVILKQAITYQLVIKPDELKALLAGDQVNWDLAVLICDYDFDIILPFIPAYIGRAQSGIADEFLVRVIDSFAKIRDLQGFIKLWRAADSENLPTDSILFSDHVLEHVTTVITSNWTLSQAFSALNSIISDKDNVLTKLDILSLIAIINGISLMAQVQNLPLSDIQILAALYDRLKPYNTDVNALRLCYSILSVNKHVVMEVIKDGNLALSEHEIELFSQSEMSASEVYTRYFQLQIIFRTAEFQEVSGLDCVGEWIVDKLDWFDKRVILVPGGTAALVRSVIDRWLILIEHRFKRPLIERLCKRFWSLANQDSEVLESLWWRLLSNPIVFDQPNMQELLSLELAHHLELKHYPDRHEILKILKTQTKVPISDSAEATVTTAIKALLKFPIECLKRALREKILDQLLLIDSWSDKRPSLRLHCRQLTYKLIEVPNMTAILQSDSIGVVYLAQRLNKSQERSFETLTVNIITKVFDHAVSGDSQDKVSLIEGANSKAYSTIRSKLRPGYTRLFCLSARYLQKSLTELSSDLHSQVEDVFNRLKVDIVERDLMDADLVRALLLSMSDATKILKPERRGKFPRELLQKLTAYIALISDASDNSKKSVYVDAIQNIFAIFCSSYLTPDEDEATNLARAQDVVMTYAALSNIRNEFPGLEDLQKMFMSVVALWNTETYRAIVDQLTQIVAHTSGNSDIKYVDAFTLLIVLERTNTHRFIEKNVTKLMCSLVLNVDKVTGLKAYLALLNMIETIITDKKSLVSPFLFEQIFVYLIRSTSCAGPKLAEVDDEDSVDTVYLKVCSVVSALLLSFPKYQRGRHNLLVSVLENLLYCLCVPRRVGVAKRLDKSTLGHRKRASWTPLDRTGSTISARAFARLLSNLCDPPSSRTSNTGLKKRNIEESSSFALSSAAGASRRALSKHAPFLIVEYCFATLNYNFAPDLRQAIMPGLYTVFDVLGQSELQVVNAAMDNAGRAIFKSLYDDYTKFGKWHEN